jgi:hypothetical protein
MALAGIRKSLALNNILIRRYFRNFEGSPADDLLYKKAMAGRRRKAFK